MENKYVLLDIGRNSYWKYNNFGYTKILRLARLFTLKQANEKANAPYVDDLEIIEYSKAKEFLDGYEYEIY